MNHPFVYSFFIFFTGACFGSFLMLVADRYETGESIIFKPSFCNKCNSKLLWWQNIPLFGSLFLQWKCYFCKSKISSRYFLSEHVTGLVSLAVFVFLLPKGFLIRQIIEVIFFLYIVILLSMFDVKYKIVPHRITYAAILLIFLEKMLFRESSLILLFNLGTAFIFMDILCFFSTVIKKFDLKISLITIPLNIWCIACFFGNKIILSLFLSVFYLVVVYLFERRKLNNKFNSKYINIFLWIFLSVLLTGQIYKSGFIDYNTNNLFVLFAGIGIIYLTCEIIAYYLSALVLKESDEHKPMVYDEKITIGGGDITFFALISVFLGVKLAFLVLFIASLLAIVSHFILRILPKFKNKNLEYVPFIPYLSAACFIIIMTLYGKTPG